MHVDLRVDGGDTLESEVERLLALGATRVAWDYAEGAQHVVLADPEGNLRLRLRLRMTNRVHR